MTVALQPDSGIDALSATITIGAIPALQVVGRLAAGTATRWSVTETLRTIYVT